MRVKEKPARITTTPIERCKQRIERTLDRYGVRTYVLIMRDPDSHSAVGSDNGDPLWILGACEFHAARTKESPVLDDDLDLEGV